MPLFFSCSQTAVVSTHFSLCFEARCSKPELKHMPWLLPYNSASFCLKTVCSLVLIAQRCSSDLMTLHTWMVTPSALIALISELQRNGHSSLESFVAAHYFSVIVSQSSFTAKCFLHRLRNVPLLHRAGRCIPIALYASFTSLAFSCSLFVSNI